MTGRSANVATAYHEAGHVVAMARFGFAPSMLSVVPRDQIAGFATHLDGWSNLRSARRYLVMLLGGYAAAVASGLARSAARRGAAHDLDEARRVLKQIGEPRRLGHYTREAEAFVRRPKNWRAITALAEVALEWRVVHAHSLDMLIDLADRRIPRERWQTEAPFLGMDRPMAANG